MRRRATILDVLRDVQGVEAREAEAREAEARESVSTERAPEPQQEPEPDAPRSRYGRARRTRTQAVTAQPSPLATPVPAAAATPVAVPAPMPVTPLLAKSAVRPSASPWTWWQASVPLPRLLLVGIGVAAILVIGIAYAAGVSRGEAFAAERQEVVNDSPSAERRPAKPGPMRVEDFGKTDTASDDVGQGRSAKQPEAPPAAPTAEKQPPKPEAAVKAAPPANHPVGWRIVSYKANPDHEPKIKALRAHINAHIRSEGVEAIWFKLNDSADWILAVTFDPKLAGDAKHRDEVFERLKALPPLKNREAHFDFAKELKPYLIYGAVR